MHITKNNLFEDQLLAKELLFFFPCDDTFIEELKVMISGEVCVELTLIKFGETVE